MLCSAGSHVPWLGISSQDMLVPFNGSETIGLTYHGEGLAAGTYRAQLCLFADYSYGKPRNDQENSELMALLIELLFLHAIRFPGWLKHCNLSLFLGLVCWRA